MPETTLTEPVVPFDWDEVPFPVACPRCATDLTGIDAHECPACSLHLDWAALVPLDELGCPQCGYLLRGSREGRCPECGGDFTWQNALAEHHARSSRLFEHRCRERFLRSLYHSVMASLRPKRLWTRLQLHEPLNSGRLVLLCMLCMVGFCAITAAMLMLVNSILWSRFMGGGGWTPTFPWHEFLAMVPPALSWLGALLGALQIFRQSMKRCRVRNVHVLRVWTYSTAAWAPWTAVIVGLALTIVVSLYYLDIWIPIGGGFLLCVIVILVLMFRALYLGYAKYLKMDHPFGIALAANVIALLTALIVALP